MPKGRAKPGRWPLRLVGYGSLRFVAEYFREPDDFLGLLSLGMSMGQWLCVPMVLAGVGSVGVGQSVTKIIRAAGACTSMVY